MDGAEIGVFEEVDQECFGAFLEGLNGLGLPAHGFTADGDETKGYFSNLKGKERGARLIGWLSECWCLKLKGGWVGYPRSGNNGLFRRGWGCLRSLTKRENGSLRSKRSVERW